MSMHATRHRSVARPWRDAGFTLIELMVAMLLGLIVIAGVTSVFLAGQESFRSNNALADVQDSSRIAFELMARDIREAGLTGCNSVNNRVTNVTKAFNNNTPPLWWSDWNNMIHGYPTAVADPALASQTVAPGTDSLELVSASGPATAIVSNDPFGYTFTLGAAATSLKNGDLALVCSPSQAAVMQIGYAGGTSISYAVSGNSSTDLGYPEDGYVDNTAAPPPTPYPFPPNSLISKVTAVDWFVGQNASGGWSLFRMDLQNTSGTPTPTAQEMVAGVSNMSILYLNPTLGSGLGNAYQTAAVIDANGGWLGVTAVQVTLTLQSTFQRASVQGNAPIARTYSFTTTLRNRVNG